MSLRIVGLILLVLVTIGAVSFQARQIGPAQQAGGPIDVQFYLDGEVLTECTIHAVVFGADGRPVGRTEHLPDGTGLYTIPVGPGQSVIFEAADDEENYLPTTMTIPVGHEGILVVPLVCVESNDECVDGTSVAVDSLTAGSTNGATVDASPECLIEQGFGAGGLATVTAPGVWYQVEGNGNQLIASTCDADSAGTSDFDTKISVYCLDCPELQCVTANDDSVSACGSLFASTASWCSRPGVTYSILVHGFGATTGEFDLAVEDAGACAGEPVECVPPDPAGACCACDDPPFFCSIETAADCAGLGGQYLGDDTACFDLIPDGLDFSTSPNAAILSGGGIDSDILVGDSFIIGDLDVDLIVSHTWVGDIVAALSHLESATTTVLIDRPGVPAISACGCSSDDYDIILDDEGAGGPIEDLCGAVQTPTSPPSYTPLQPLDVFDGLDASGTWRLTIADAEPLFDDGTLDHWSLHFTEGTPVCAAFCDDYVSNISNQFVYGTYVRQHDVYSMPVDVTTIELYASFLPSNLGLDGLDVASDGNVFFSTQSNGSVAGVYVHQDRIYHYDRGSGAVALAFDPGTTDIDALDVIDDWTAVFSVDSNQFAGGMYLYQQNAYEISAGGISLLFDGKALGLGSMDGVDRLPDGRIAFSTESNQWLLNMYIQHENSYIYDPVAETLELGIDGAGRHLNGLDAFSQAIGTE